MTLVLATRAVIPGAAFGITPTTKRAGESIKAAFTRLISGLKSLPLDFQKQRELRTLEKQRGSGALSYSDFKFLERAGDDVGKLLRAGLFCLASPEYFFYSYLVIPVMSSGNPWAWRTHPSGFDSQEDKFSRDRICIHRRQIAVVSALTTLFAGCADDSDAKLRDARRGQLALVQEAIEVSSSKGIASALQVLDPWINTNTGKFSKNTGSRRLGHRTDTAAAPTLTGVDKQASSFPRVKLDIQGVPWATVKDMCRAVGVDGVPNIWLLRRMNRGELIKYYDTIRNGDEFISSVGVGALGEDEVLNCCIERCISVDPSRNNKALRHDLQTWIQLATAKDGRNEQNKRLVLSSLHVCRDVSRDPSGLGGSLRAILKT